MSERGAPSLPAHSLTISLPLRNTDPGNNQQQLAKPSFGIDAANTKERNCDSHEAPTDDDGDDVAATL